MEAGEIKKHSQVEPISWERKRFNIGITQKSMGPHPWSNERAHSL
jgi:hypothetical protein